MKPDFALRGIFSIQHYSGIPTQDLAEGFGQTEEKLSNDQVLHMSTVATSEKFFNLAVDWLEVAVVRSRNCSKRLKEALQEAKDGHDRELMGMELGTWDKTNNVVSHLREEPYDEELRKSELFQRKRELT